MATALCSALSLDFFLTQPYLRLTISDKHDVIAFAGLAACGLLAATIGSRRAARMAELQSTRKALDLLHEAIMNSEGSEPLDSRFSRLLAALRATCPISAASIRDDRDTLVAGVDQGRTTGLIPALILSAQTLVPRGAEAVPGNYRLPVEGARSPLIFCNRQVGWLDLWGNREPVTAQARRLLADVAGLLALQMAAAASSPDRGDAGEPGAQAHKR
jgi:K+-sensing histidine kinase KdpD